MSSYNSKEAQVLFVGPLPPPIGGATISFQTFVEAWATLHAQRFSDVPVLNTSPGQKGFLYKNRYLRGVAIIAKLAVQARKHNSVVLFNSTSSFLRNAGLFLMLKRRVRRNFIISFFGSNLVDAIHAAKPDRRTVLINCLRGMDRVIVETDLLKTGLSELGVTNVDQVPGFRQVRWDALPGVKGQRGEELRVVFVGQVREDKGVLLLVEAVQQLVSEGVNITCDIYGPIEASWQDQFTRHCSNATGVNYKGVLNSQDSKQLSTYDALVLPTWYAGEGHPGVIIEAMMAGIPVIATKHKAIPEIVHNGVNGLLVVPNSVSELISALRRLYAEPALLRQLALGNRQQLKVHDVAKAVKAIEKYVV